REIMIEVPKTKWSDVGGLEEVKKRLKESIEWPLKYPDSFKNMGIKPPKGILLYGPPGCGKTLMARAVANESKSNFISVKGPELLSKWVGESEKMIRKIFRKAKQVSPTIIFFDEIDSMAPSRSVSSSDSRVGERVVSQLLSELSGLEELHDVVVLAATNRPDIIDLALLRPGRFDKQILIPEPDEKSRLKILEIYTKKMPLDKVDLKKMAKDTDGYSGADIEALCREAALCALREDIKSNKVTMKHFKSALKEITPSLTENVKKYYRTINMKKKLGEVKEISYVG
ncbi:MAG: AAA family ATPase, partial [Candidatus Aenigmarchaeota archaeon]|nr:AAA family ATPase [Candidatus Aenigmarchaeota archaeon]